MGSPDAGANGRNRIGVAFIHDGVRARPRHPTPRPFEVPVADNARTGGRPPVHTPPSNPAPPIPRLKGHQPRRGQPTCRPAPGRPRRQPTKRTPRQPLYLHICVAVPGPPQSCPRSSSPTRPPLGGAFAGGGSLRSCTFLSPQRLPPPISRARTPCPPRGRKA